MIQRIEVWNFESHEHSVLEDLSPGLNLLVGESNSGKTSISARALKLVAYNDFNPRSVRTGATHCVVQVDTDKGRVKVSRGPKHNAWEVTKTGQSTQYFDKVGVNIIPEVAEIIGLNIVTLGDVKVPVNIMDQLESHFMLAGVGDKDATGSMRAQIVDEISGLSGIESIIKDVSLDNTRFGREVKVIEKQMEVVRGQLYPEHPLKEEEEVLTKADQELKDHRMMLALIDEGNDLVGKGSSVSQQIGDLNHRVSEIPNTVLALQELSRADELIDRVASAETLHRDGTVASDHLSEINKALVEIPDVQAAACLLNESDLVGKILINAVDVNDKWMTSSKNVSGIKKALSVMPDTQMAAGFINDSDLASKTLASAVDVHSRWSSASRDVGVKQDRDKQIGQALTSNLEIVKAQDAVTRRNEAETLFRDVQQKMAGLMGLKQRLADQDISLNAAEKERDDLLASIKTCPLTLKPVSKECVEGVIA